MHFEILVEDASGKIIIDNIMDKLCSNLGGSITHRTISYKGIGRLPKNLEREIDPSRKVLLDKLPQIIRGYGKSLPKEAALVVVVDCDKKDCRNFKQELSRILDACIIKPRTIFCIAIEEIEAWLLGDRQALMQAYPNARKSVLDRYVQDSICDTWEMLANAIYSGRAKGLRSKGYPDIGIVKCEWAEKISPYMNIENNQSPSFQYFIRKIRELVRPA